MRSLYLLVIPFLFNLSLVFSQKQLTLEEIWGGEFRTERLTEVHALQNGKEYSVFNYNRSTHETTIEVFSYTDASKKRILLSSEDIELPYFENYSFSPNEKWLLLGTEIKQRYRYSETGIYFIYNQASKNLIQVFDAPILSPKFSPDGNKIAFVFENNLYYKDLESYETVQITTDGKKNKLINGLTDWVYEEEFELVSAYEWNSDSSQLAFLKFNESQVPEYRMEVYDEGNYPEKETFKYPKAGEINSSVSAHLYSTTTTETVTIDLTNYETYYLPRLQWTNDSNQLIIQTLNRHQNNLQIISVNTHDFSTNLLYSETDSAYIEIDNHLTFLKDNSFLLTSEKSGFTHLYHYSSIHPDIKEPAKLISQITKGDWELTDFYGIDTGETNIFYQSTKGNNIERQLFKASLSGENEIQLSTENGTHKALFNSDFSLYIDTFSNTKTPYTFSIHDANTGNKLRVLKDNTSLSEKLSKYQLSKKEFSTIKINGNNLNTWTIKPADFNPLKKYPVLLFQYSGPGSQTVKNSWNTYNDLWHQLLTQKGYIITCIDGRGTGYKGSDFKKNTQLQLGKFEAEDQIAYAKALSKLLYIDSARIGIWGWSYGGFTALNSILNGNDVFSSAIAVAPVTHWKYYDTIYTERFLTTPQENPLGYNKNSPLSHADKLKGNLLLVHGTADDNVHIQNTLQMAKELTKANKQFELAIYTDKNHGIYGGNTRLHLFTKMTNFILKNL